MEEEHDVDGSVDPAHVNANECQSDAQRQCCNQQGGASDAFGLPQPEPEDQ